MKTNNDFHGKCVSCNSFRNSAKGGGYRYCVGNSQAFREMTGKRFSRGAPEGPSFQVRKLDGCKFWNGVW